MLLESARVVASDDESLWVETIRRSTCGSCEARSGCGHSLLNRIGEGRRSTLRVLPGQIDHRSCAIDDQVTIGIPEDVILRGSAILYLLPLMCLLFGAAAAASIFPNSSELAAAFGAVAGFTAGFALVRRHARAHLHDPELQPVLMATSPAESGYPNSRGSNPL